MLCKSAFKLSYYFLFAVVRLVLLVSCAQNKTFQARGRRLGKNQQLNFTQTALSMLLMIWEWR